MQLANSEYNVLNKIASKTKMDCWFSLEQDENNNDYVRDLENGTNLTLREGLLILVDGLDCQENYNSCNLLEEEDKIFRNLLENLDINFLN